MKRGSKKWWTRAKELMDRKTKVSAIPALKNAEGRWVTVPKEKADLLADTFSAKCHLPAKEYNDLSELTPRIAEPIEAIPSVSEVAIEAIMEELNEGSATGPDHIPTKVLKRFAKALAPVIHRLASQILKEGRWPESWAMHWIIPNDKKKKRCSTLEITAACI